MSSQQPTGHDDEETEAVLASADLAELEIAAGRLTFADAVRIRREAPIAEKALPRLLAEGRDAGRRVATMAAELDLTQSYAHRLIREYRAAQQ